MPEIDDYELNIRRQKLISQYQRCQSNIESINSGNFDKSPITSTAVTGQFAGRPVTHADNTHSKETQLYQIYLNSTVEDQLCSNYVNTVKKTESHLPARNLINPRFLWA